MGRPEEGKVARKMYDVFLEIKNNNRNITKKQLAEEFEVSEDTIRNYVRALNNQFGTNIHIVNRNKYAIDDYGEFSELKSTYPLGADDIIIILSALIDSQSFMERKMGLIKKALFGILDNKERNKLEDMMYIERDSKKDSQQIEINVKKIMNAIVNEKKISFIYHSSKGSYKNEKMIPYSFVCELGMYYIIGKTDKYENLVHLRLDRMSHVKVLEEKGVRNKEFNVNDYMKRTWYMYGGPETKVKVKFEQQCRKVVTERNMTEGKMLEENDEYFIYEFICNGTDGIKMWLMGFGAQAEVLEPVELRKEFKQIAENMIKNYK